MLVEGLTWDFWSVATTLGLAIVGVIAFLGRAAWKLDSERNRLSTQLMINESKLEEKADSLAESRQTASRLQQDKETLQQRNANVERSLESSRDLLSRLTSELDECRRRSPGQDRTSREAELQDLVTSQTEEIQSLQVELSEVREAQEVARSRVDAIDRVALQSWKLGFMPLNHFTKSRLPALGSRKSRVVSFVNQKGGVGKTSLCLNFGHQFAVSHAAARVLLIDLDSQGNLTRLCGQADYIVTDEHQDREKSVWSSFVDTGIASLRDFALPSKHAENVWVLPASRSMNNFEGEMYRLLHRSMEAKNNRDPRGVFLSEIERSIRESDSDAFDLILFDCPPARGMVTESALLASDFFVIPAEAADFTIEGAQRVRESINKLRKERDGTAMERERLRVYLNKVRFYAGEPITQQRGSIESYRKAFADTMAPESCWVTSSPGILAGQIEGPAMLASPRGGPEKEFLHRMKNAYQDFVRHIQLP